jgi:pimeloyl-ACP methyl ester carboxylesterase
MSGASETAVTSADGTRIAVHTMGSGPGLVVVGGALQAAEDYLGLARLLAQSFTVHVTDRRGRGRSGPHGAGYSLESECQDLDAVQQATGARLVFGHSYGGLIVLEAMARGADVEAASVFEPGVSVDGSLPSGWLPRYRELLAEGDPYGAFAHFIQANPQSPAFARLLPHSSLRLLLRAMPGFRDRVAPRLEGNALEHEQVAERDNQLPSYRTVAGTVQLLAGGRSPDFVRATVESLAGTIPDSSATVLPGVGHLAPLAKNPTALARVVGAHLSGPT